MQIINNILSFFTVSNEDKNIIFSEIEKENSRRTFYTAIAGVLISTFSIILFSSKTDYSSEIEEIWVLKVFSLHILVLIVSTIVSAIIYLTYYLKKTITILTKMSTVILIVFLQLVGIMFTTYDQYITSSISAYMITSLILGVVFLIRPLYVSIIFIISYLFFNIAIAQTQLNEEVLISNQINGLSITAMGLFLSFILWRSKLVYIRQREKIIAQNKELKESNDQKDRFFSIIVHDLRNPFNSIVGFTNLLQKKVNEKSLPDIEKYSKYIQTSATKAMDLLSNLMIWTQSQTDRIDHSPELFDIVTTVTNASSILESSIKQKHLTLKIITPDSLMAYADENMVATVLRNLISNAIKFSNPYDQITVFVREEDDFVVTSVKDNGIGIPKESITKLFKIDENFTTDGTMNEKGTGLGLILCKEFVEKNKGTIWVNSEPGNGTVFHFTLPHSIGDD